MRDDKHILWAIGTVLVIIIIVLLVQTPKIGYFNNLGAAAYVPYQYPTNNTVVMTFDSCKLAGYPISGTNPVICRLPSGQVYEQIINTGTSTSTRTIVPSQQVTYTTTTQTTPTYTAPTTYTSYDTQYTQPYYTNQYQYQYNQNQGSCYVSGRNNNICSDQPYVYSEYSYSPQASCFQQNSTCTRQNNGQCGWTQTSSLQYCLNRGY